MSEATIRIALRLIVDGAAVDAKAAWVRVAAALAGLVTIGEVAINAYWKIPGTQEISSTLRVSVDSAEDAYEEVARRLASGWTDHTDDQFARWTVWNRGDGSFIAPAVRWAQVELIRL